MSGTIALAGPSTTPGVPALTAPAINTAVNAALATKLAAAGGNASLVLATATGGTASRTLATWLGDEINLIGCGADASGVADSTAAWNTFVAAVISTGNPGFMPPGTYALTGPLTFDLGASRTKGFRIYGAGGQQSILSITNAGSSPAMLIQCSAGASFYHEFADFAVRSSCAAPVLQIGRNLGVPANGQPNYPDAANSWRIHGLIVNNSSTSGSAQAVQVNGLYNSDVYLVANCAGAGDALRLNEAQFSIFAGSWGNANIGLHLAEFYSFANTFLSADIEVVNNGVMIDSANATNNTFIGPQIVVSNGAVPVAAVVASAGANNRFIGLNVGGTAFSGTTGVIVYGQNATGTETFSAVAASTVTASSGLTAGTVSTGNALTMAGAASGSDVAFTATGIDANIAVDVNAKGTGSVKLISNGITSVFATSTGAMIGNTGQSIGFYGATRVAKQTVTGAKGANAALTSLLTALAALGLITDSST